MCQGLTKDAKEVNQILIFLTICIIYWEILECPEQTFISENLFVFISLEIYIMKSGSKFEVVLTDS